MQGFEEVVSSYCEKGRGFLLNRVSCTSQMLPIRCQSHSVTREERE